MILVLIRGLPGAGKSRLAKSMRGPVFEADDFFTFSDGSYNFDKNWIQAAHDLCFARAENALRVEGCAIVANTFSTNAEMRRYLNTAHDSGATTLVIDLFDAGLSDSELAARCVHGVPVSTVQNMRRRWECTAGC